MPGAPGLVDEVPDQVVGDLAEGFRGQDCVGQLVERVGVHLLDGVDQLVETDGVGDFGRRVHGVNPRLTHPRCQPRVDATEVST